MAPIVDSTLLSLLYKWIGGIPLGQLGMTYMPKKAPPYWHCSLT